EFDVEVRTLPPSNVDRQTLTQWVGMAIQSGELPLSDALAIMLEPDQTVAVRKFIRKYTMRQMFLNQQQQQQAQMEQQMQQQQLAAQMQQQQGNWQNAMQQIELKNQNQLEKTALTGRVKLQDRKLQRLQR